MNTLPELLTELFEKDHHLRRDLKLMRSLSCQERHFLARTARFWGLPTGAYIRFLIRSGGDPFFPSRPEV